MTWREFLGNIIHNPVERQRIAASVEVKEITLQRWVLDRASPHPRNLHQLLDALPQFHDVLFTLIRKEFPDFEDVTASMRESVPTIIYSLVLDAYVNHTETLSRGAIFSLVLSNVLTHIDPDRTNAYVSLAYCVPCLHSLVLSKTSLLDHPTTSNVYLHSLLLGAESLASCVAATCTPAIIQHTDQEYIFPLSDAERHTNSIAAWPVQRHGNVAAVFVVTSLQSYFFSELRIKIIAEYVRLLTLAFREQDFLACETLSFHVMPADQEHFVRTWRSRFPINSYPYREAERVMYQHIESEMSTQGDENEEQRIHDGY